MDITAIVLGVILTGLSMAFIYKPFQEKKAGVRKQVEAESKPQARRESVLSALSDLDFDFKTGKVVDEDYAPLRERLLAEAAQLTLKEQEKEDRLEALIQRRRNGGQGHACEKCGTALAAGQKFCSNCGSAVKQEACPSCGSKIKSGDLFCSACGKPIELQTNAVVQA